MYRRGLWLLVALLAPAALAQGRRAALVPQLLDATGVPEAAARRVQASAQAVLTQLSALAVGAGPAWKPGPRKSCADLPCQRAVVSTAGAPAVVLLGLRPSRAGLSFDVSFWLEGERVGAPQQGEAELEAPETGLKPALEAVLPAWARQGWGALRLEPEAGAVVKLDGRVVSLTRGELLSVPAGAHQLDVVHPDGSAVLQRVEVPEGSRTRVDLSHRPQLAAATRAEGTSAVRAVSFGLWVAGAAAIAGSLVAGSLSRQTGAGQNPCSGDSRACSTLEVATERQRQAQAYASTGNVLLGAGAVLAGAGVGLFAFDLVRNK